MSAAARGQRPLTVTGLIRLLRTLPGDHLVILSSDAEGNQLSPASPDVGVGMYQDFNGRTGEVYPMPDELDREPGLLALYPRGIPAGARAAVVVYPTA